MPNFPLLALSEKLTFLVGNWGLIGQAHSDALAMAYENFLIEVGLYGSPLNWKYGMTNVALCRQRRHGFKTFGNWFRLLVWRLLSVP